MEILYLLIPLTIIILLVMAGFFIWSVKSGQMDDLEGPAYRILMDDDTIHDSIQPKSESTQEKESKEVTVDHSNHDL